MYRDSIDNATIYSAEDINLFKDSPFASWMERLTLENPDHGIGPDIDSNTPSSGLHRQRTGLGAVRRGNTELIDWEELVQLREKPPTLTVKTDAPDEFVQSFAAQGKVVVLIDQMKDELLRRTETLAAMREGADLIVHAQLTSGPLSESADLLVRTTGYSDLGNYLYIPCDTGPKTTPQCIFRLCFLADLLHSLQGYLPPQLLIIRPDSNMVSVPTEGHIYYYRGVKQRFMVAQRAFRKHRMPDPAASSHFGRWSACAHDVLKQRAFGEETCTELALDAQEGEPAEVTPQAMVGGGVCLVADIEHETPAPQAYLATQDSTRTSPYNEGPHVHGNANAKQGQQVRERLPVAGFSGHDLPAPAAVGVALKSSRRLAVSVKDDIRYPAPAVGPEQNRSRYSLTGQPMIDRDTAIQLTPEVRSIPGPQLRPSVPNYDDGLPGLPVESARPFSSTLITCMDSDD